MWTFSLMMGRKDNIQHLKCAVHLPTAGIFPFKLHRVVWMHSGTCKGRDIPILTAVRKAYTNVS